jgi:hypothetical protein
MLTPPPSRVAHARPAGALDVPDAPTPPEYRKRALLGGAADADHRRALHPAALRDLPLVACPVSTATYSSYSSLGRAGLLAIARCRGASRRASVGATHPTYARSRR